MSWRDALPAVRGRLLRDEPLGPFTWFRVGGAADVLFLPADPQDLDAFLQALPQTVPVTVLGHPKRREAKASGRRSDGVRTGEDVPRDPGARKATSVEFVMACAGGSNAHAGAEPPGFPRLRAPLAPAWRFVRRAFTLQDATSRIRPSGRDRRARAASPSAGRRA